MDTDVDCVGVPSPPNNDPLEGDGVADAEFDTVGVTDGDDVGDGRQRWAASQPTHVPMDTPEQFTRCIPPGHAGQGEHTVSCTGVHGADAYVP